MKIANVYVGNKCISIISNKYKIISELKLEYSDYFKFKIEEEIKGTDKINIIESSNLYEKFKIAREIKHKKNENYFRKDRNCIVVMNKLERNIDILCESYGIIESQYVGEILISMFGKYYEDNGFYFFHASGVSKNNKSVVIAGSRNSGKTSVMSILLQNDFDYIANSRIGINDSLYSIGQPYMLGMRINTIYKSLSEDHQDRIFKTEDYQRVEKILELWRFNGDKEAILKRYYDRKINLKNKEIKEIFNCGLKKKSNLKAIIIPEYCSNLQRIEIEKLNKSEKMTILVDNYEGGIYSSVKYLNELYKRNNRKIPNNVINKIDFYKVRQNENTNSELINWINKLILGE